MPLADIDITSALPWALAIAFAMALLISGFAHAAAASNHADLAEELDVAWEALDAGAHALTKVAAGIPLAQALVDLPQDPEAIDAFKRALNFFRKTAPAALLLVFAVGCASPVTKVQVAHVRKALADERRAVVARPGFEADVWSIRDAVDADLAAIESASRD